MFVEPAERPSFLDQPQLSTKFAELLLGIDISWKQKHALSSDHNFNAFWWMAIRKRQRTTAIGLHLRRTALRLLSSSPTSFLSKPRSVTTITASALRIPQQSTRIAFQRRWATNEAEVKKDDENLPISELQPTPEDEVENAIHDDNAAEPAERTPLPDSQAPSGEQSVLHSAVEIAAETATNAAASVTEAAQSVSSAFAGSERGQDQRQSRIGRIGEPKPTIYIGNLFFDVTENDLVKELSRFGPIVKCRLMRDSRGLSKGFGYVDFETTEQATKAIEALNQQLFEGRRLAVQYAAYESKTLENRRGSFDRAPRPLNPPSKTLFIGNMSFEMTDRDLNNLFKGIRNVIDVRVAIDRRTGQPRGFAHADFVDTKSAMEAMKHLEGKEPYGRKIRLDYSYGPSNAPKNQGNSDGHSGGA